MFQGKSNLIFYVHDFYFENRAVYEIIRKDVVEPDRPQMTIQYGACTLHTG